MDRPVDPATPFREVYQHFLSILAKHGHKERTRLKYMYDYQRFKRWLSFRHCSTPIPTGVVDKGNLLTGSQPSGHRRMGVADKAECARR